MSDIAATTKTVFRLAGEFLELEAQAAEGDGPKVRRFNAVAYTGAAMKLDGYGRSPVVVDLAGLRIPDGPIPVLRSHDHERTVGHTAKVEASAQKLKVSGLLSGVGPDVESLTASADRGFPWQVSIGADESRVEFVASGETVKVNGRTFAGPVQVVRAARLREVSLVSLGADAGTNADIAASFGGSSMEFNSWLTDNGFDPATVAANEKQNTKLSASWKAENTPTLKPAPKVDDLPVKAGQSVTMTYTERRAAIEAENARIEHIESASISAMGLHKGDSLKCKQIAELTEAAVANEKVDQRQFDLDLLRLSRQVGPFLVTGRNDAKPTADVVEAAVCRTHGLRDYEKKFSPQTLEAADKHFKNGMTLKKLLLLGARNNGYTGDDSDYYGVCQAAMARDGHNIRADVGVSTGVQVPGILGNTANKFLAESFMAIDQSWRGIAQVRPVTDFKQITTYRMAGDNTFLRVAPTGEIKHGAMSETSYTNQAKTYGRLLGISREDYINDDLGAFTSVAQELGRGAADALNNIFWAAWLDDSAFFKTDASYGNYDAGATDSVLSVAGLDNAEGIMAVQTKPDGGVLGVAPQILLVPSALKNTAMQLMMSPNLAVGTTPASGPSTNIYAGRYAVVASPYLHRTTLKDENGVSQTVGGSATAWYLLCNPNDIAGIQVVFLNGKDTPTVETAEFTFDRLGLATRAYFDFGVSKQEYRCGVKLKGAA